MKHDIDLWGKHHPFNHRWDKDKNAKLLNIIYQGGTFGSFLKFFIDKFSKLSPNIDGDPFTSIGTSHSIGAVSFSGLVQRYHPSFINDNHGETQLPICIILPTTRKHHLYLKKAQWFKTGEQPITPDDIWRLSLGDMPEWVFEQVVREIIRIYDIKETSHFSWIPKFIVRDFYKLEFLQDLEKTHNYQWFDSLKTHSFFNSQNVFHLDLETFFDRRTFMANMEKLDTAFNLSLDFDRQEEMKELFDKGLSLDSHRQECNTVERIVEGNQEGVLSGLDVASEAFIYAEMEKRNDFIQMPLGNRFFRDTEELKQFITYYPNHYKAMNPNMPKFNGIANPYYLKKGK